VDSVWVDDFKAFSRRQWEDFDFRLEDGESLRQVQQRNVAALNALLLRHPGEHFAIGTHGTALSTVLNHFDPGFGYEAFWSIVDRMPWIVCLEFEGFALQRQYSIG
jgi:2,3-bisphosphoglycerate-dependent phosphoglycerate mutase